MTQPAMTPAEITPRPNRYRWVIFGLTALNLMVEGGLKNTTPIMFVALRQSFGQSAAATASLFSISGLVGGLCAPFVGRLLDRLGPRYLFPLAGLVIMLAWLASSFVTELWQLIIFYSIISTIGENSISSFTAMANLAPWFRRSRGRVMGLADAGNPLGQGIFAPLAQLLILSVGWRSTFRIYGVVFFLLLAPANYLLQRRPPVNGEAVPAPAAGESVAHREPPPPVGLTLRKPAAWLLVLARLVATTGNQLVTVHVVAFFITSGYSELQAAAAIGFVGIISLGGRPLSGLLSDYLGRELMGTVGFGMQIVGIAIVLAFGQGQLWPLLVYVGFLGLSDGVSGLVINAKAADLFPSNQLGTVMGLIQMGRGAGIAIGPVLGGLLFDLQGDYLLAFAIASGLMFAAMCSLWLVRLAAGRGQY